MMTVSSGARTNMKVGGTSPAQSARKIFFGRAPTLFSTISRFGEHFCAGQYSLVSFLFAVLLTVPPMPSHL